jgi:hypothetical protein
MQLSSCLTRLFFSSTELWLDDWNDLFVSELCKCEHRTHFSDNSRCFDLLVVRYMAPVMLGACSFFFWVATKVHTHNALFIYCESKFGLPE